MNYPSINEYKEAILFAEDNFEQLKNLRPVLDEEGNPVMTSGNFAVVFKMKDEQTGKQYAVKCFLREQEGRAEAYRMIAEELEYVSSTFLTPIKYLDKELFVDTNAGDEKEFPVLLMDWVEGETLDKYIRKHLDDQYELSLLAYQFSRLAMWLMPQPFAHGDLKPDNILVKDDGTLVLVDYDGMYVPAMKGQKARELGSPDFRHPSRTETDFDEHIDDFSLASILLSLKTISLQPSLLEKYGASDRLLFSANDYRNISESEALNALRPLMQDAELASLYSLFILALSQNNLSQVSFRLFNLSRSKEPKYEDEGTIIENGLLLTNNKKQLIKLIDHSNIVVTIPRETRYVKDNAFILASDDYKPHFIRILNDKISYFPTSARILVPNDSVKESLVKNGFYEEQIVVGDIFIDEYGVAYSADKTTLILYPHYLEHTAYQINEECNSIEECAFPVIGDCDPDDLFVSFSGNSLETLYIPSTLKKVGKSAFDGCMELKTVIIPKGTRDQFEKLLPDFKDKLVEQADENLSTEVTQEDLANAWTDEYGVMYSADGKRLLKATLPLNDYKITARVRVICNSAFYSCDLTRITIPDSVTVIGDEAFEYCYGLTSISIPNSVKIIGEYAFYYCSGLTSIKIPNSVTVIGYRAFDCCGGLTSITIPDSVTTIGDEAFKHCDGLTSITIPDSLTAIGDGVFKYCGGLTSIEIPHSVKTIGVDSFFDCDGIESITIPDNVTAIGDRAFGGCSGLTSITIPDRVTSIGHGVFWGCSGLMSIVVENSNSVYDSRNNCNAIIETSSNRLIGGCGTTKIPNSVTAIGNYAFGGYSGNITIPDSVTAIGYCAFMGCSGLTSITIPDGVTAIEDSAFEGCSGLTSITIPDSVIVIEFRAFCYCSGLTSITIPDSVTVIGDEAFRGCSGLTSITIPDSVTTIGREAFVDCRGLTSITIPNGVTAIGNNAFKGCRGLTSITIPDNVTSIGDSAFRFCSGLTNITIPDSVTVIGDGAFEYCSGLTSITIPDSVNIIGKGAFRHCTGLGSVKIPDSVTIIGNNAFVECSGLTCITIPDSVTAIGDYVFWGCSSLTSITIPDSVTAIGNDAFRDCCALIRIIIPIGTRDKFGELLPEHKDKLVEQINGWIVM